MTETHNTSGKEDAETPKPVLMLKAGMGSPGFGFLVATANTINVWSRSEQRNIPATIGEFRVTEEGEVFLRVYYKNDPQRRFKLLRKEDVDEQNGCTLEILMSPDMPQFPELAKHDAVQPNPTGVPEAPKQAPQTNLEYVWNRLRGLFGGQ